MSETQKERKRENRRLKRTQESIKRQGDQMARLEELIPDKEDLIAWLDNCEATNSNPFDQRARINYFTKRTAEQFIGRDPTAKPVMIAAGSSNHDLYQFPDVDFPSSKKWPVTSPQSSTGLDEEEN